MDIESTSASQLTGDTADTQTPTIPRERPSSIALDMDYSSSNTLAANSTIHEQLRPSLSRIADPPPTESAGAAQNIRYTIGRLLNEIDEVADTNPIMGDLRRQLLSMSQRLQNTRDATDNNDTAVDTTAATSRLTTGGNSTPSGNNGVPRLADGTVRGGSHRVIRASSQQVLVTPSTRPDTGMAIAASMMNLMIEWPALTRLQVASTPGDGGDTGGEQQSSGARTTSYAQELRDLARLLQNPAVQAVLRWLLRVSPFIVIFFIKWTVEHCIRIVLISTAVFAFIDCNLRLARYHSNAMPVNAPLRQRLLPLRALVAIVVWALVTHRLLAGDRLYAPLMYASPNIPLDSVCNTLWVAFIADTTAKFIAMVAKAFVALLPMLSTRRRGRIFQCMEYGHQVYRYTLTPLLWIQYYQYTRMHGTVDESVDSSLVPDGILVLVNYGLIGNTHTGVTTMRAFCTGMYCITKVWQVWPLLARFYRAVRTLCTPQPYGVRASGDLLAKAGNQCAVCFGEFNRPLALSCGHVFCEECIGTWLDRERTCPICRQRVVDDDNDWTDATTTCLIQLF